MNESETPATKGAGSAKGANGATERGRRMRRSGINFIIAAPIIALAAGTAAIALYVGTTHAVYYYNEYGEHVFAGSQSAASGPGYWIILGLIQFIASLCALNGIILVLRGKKYSALGRAQTLLRHTSQGS